MFETDTRQPVAAGGFYPADPDSLKLQIKEFLDQSEYYQLPGIKAIIAPHAGYIYSGQVAADAYRQVQDQQYDLIVVIAPSHSEYFNHISVYPGTAYATPLGKLDIDHKSAELLYKESSFIKPSARGHNQEHSLEVQLPFLQVVLGNTKIIPMVIGNQDPSLVQELARAISGVFKGKNILIVASTDLSHYHSYREAVSLDNQVKKLVANFDTEGLAEKFYSQDIEMCGGGPAITAMMTARNLGASKVKVITCQNSGDVTGDKSAVVGYLSAVFY
ncbi:MAG: AmmeMemoRadiSam system protein B [Actinomycetia bacterium]|nr:AmmeMemoRadiSam system protein B [Actinomycetes bacterium]